MHPVTLKNATGEQNPESPCPTNTHGPRAPSVYNIQHGIAPKALLNHYRRNGVLLQQIYQHFYNVNYRRQP
jgi:hypothetical protein